MTIVFHSDLGNGIIAPGEPKGSGKENMGPFGSYPNQQIDWLKNDLATVNRTATPWVIVGYHRPWYVSQTSPVDPGPQTAFEPIFNQYGVDLCISGHEHIYLRTLPVNNGTLDAAGYNNPAAPVYIVNGAAGHYDGLDVLTFKANYSVFQTDK